MDGMYLETAAVMSRLMVWISSMTFSVFSDRIALIGTSDTGAVVGAVGAGAFVGTAGGKACCCEVDCEVELRNGVMTPSIELGNTVELAVDDAGVATGAGATVVGAGNGAGFDDGGDADVTVAEAIDVGVITGVSMTGVLLAPVEAAEGAISGVPVFSVDGTVVAAVGIVV